MSSLKRPLSEAQLRANRENAKKSTGPRTEEGKARSSRNAVTHGLTARDLTALGEDYELLATTVNAYLESWSPRTPYEAALVKNLATLQVRLDRCVRMETGLLDMEIPGVGPDDSHETANSAVAMSFVERESNFNNYSRYETNLSRAYDRALKQLLAVRKERLVRKSSPDETKPFPVENKEQDEAVEPNQSRPRQTRRYEMDSPIDPAATASRRHGHFASPPKREKPAPELIWIMETDEGEVILPMSGAPPITRP